MVFFVLKGVGFILSNICSLIRPPFYPDFVSFFCFQHFDFNLIGTIRRVWMIPAVVIDWNYENLLFRVPENLIFHSDLLSIDCDCFLKNNLQDIDSIGWIFNYDVES